MNGNEKHYYLHKGKKYETMKEVCEALGISSRAFRYEVKNENIIKVNNSQKRHYEEQPLRES